MSYYTGVLLFTGVYRCTQGVFRQVSQCFMHVRIIDEDSSPSSPLYSLTIIIVATLHIIAILFKESQVHHYSQSIHIHQSALYSVQSSSPLTTPLPLGSLAFCRFPFRINNDPHKESLVDLAHF